MVAQTSLSSSPVNGKTVQPDTSAPEGVIGSIAELGSNITTLAELQAQLTIADLKESTQQATWPVALLATSLVLLLAALPVALIGASELLADTLRLVHRGYAYLIVAGITAAITTILAFISVPLFFKSLAPMKRSQEEFARNVAWVKRVLASSGRKSSWKR
jgi:hypothetical protein